MEYLAIAIGYLLGSIPFGLLAGLMCGKDVRKEGSGNIGATNVVRVCGKKIGIPVFILDVIKGVVPVLIAAHMAGADNTIQVLSGLAAVLGHNFPVWLKFKGGKGVATSAGVIGALMPVQLGIALGAFLIVVLATRYISAGSMIAGVVLVGAQMLYPDDPFAAEEIPNSVMAALICVLVIVRHRSNISRLLAGTESKIGAKKKEEAKSDE